MRDGDGFQMRSRGGFGIRIGDGIRANTHPILLGEESQLIALHDAVLSVRQI